MRHYRGFNNEARLGFIGPPGATTVTTGGVPIVGYTSGSGWAARPIHATEYYSPPTIVAIPPSADIPPLPPEIGWDTGWNGIPGDIRDPAGRISPVDDMTAENGIPGVDNGGAFPYGDPRVPGEVAPTTVAGINPGLIIAALLAFAVLGG